MIKIENVEVMGWEHVIRGMRNPMNSWEKSDSFFCKTPDEKCSICEARHTDQCYNGFVVGTNDLNLMKALAAGGPVHAKYRRMITVYVDITAPLYWWKEFDTYKVGTVANSCSTMHKIHDKEFTLEDFSTEHLLDCESVAKDQFYEFDCGRRYTPTDSLVDTIKLLNFWREQYLNEKSKLNWWQMIQLLPSSYNQKRTVMLNYEVLAGIYLMRKNHKLDEWREFCQWIEQLPYSEIIVGVETSKLYTDGKVVEVINGSSRA